jgi:hypothetical protein
VAVGALAVITYRLAAAVLVFPPATSIALSVRDWLTWIAAPQATLELPVVGVLPSSV